jgi:hypothetical protein
MREATRLARMRVSSLAADPVTAGFGRGWGIAEGEMPGRTPAALIQAAMP